MLVGIRSIAVDDFRARVGGIILAFSFLSVHVTPIVGIFLVEILASEHAFKVHHSVVQRQTGSLEEEPVLQSSPVLEMLFSAKGNLELRHAQWHVLQVAWNIVCVQLEPVRSALVLVVVLLGVHGGDVLQKPGGALQRWSGRDGTQESQLSRKVGAEPGGYQAQQFGFWNVGHSFVDVYLSVLNQIQCLREWNAVDVLVASRYRQWVLVQTRGCSQDLWQKRFELALGQDMNIGQNGFESFCNSVAGLAVVQTIF